MTTASRLSNNVTQKLSKAFGAGKFTISDKSGSNGEYGCFVLLQMLELYSHLSSHICLTNLQPYELTINSHYNKSLPY